MRLAASDNPRRAWAGVHLTALGVAILPGLVVFGWRAAAVLLLCLGAAFAASLVLRNAGHRGRSIERVHLTWSALLAAAVMPAHWATFERGLAALPVAAGLLVVAFTWLAGRGGAGVIPALSAGLIMVALAGDESLATRALVSDAAVVGDLLDDRPIDRTRQAQAPWLAASAPVADGADALELEPARQTIFAFNRGEPPPEGRRLTIPVLVADRLPPPEDLVLLGHPAPIGMASAAAVVAAGLILCFRGIADARIAILAVAAAHVALSLLPVPAVVTADEVTWTWGLGLGGLGDGPGASFGPSIGLTYVHYELRSGPILFGAMLIAPLASLRPLAWYVRLPYAIVAGLAMAAAHRYLGPQVAPLVALLILGSLTPLFDRHVTGRWL